MARRVKKSHSLSVKPPYLRYNDGIKAYREMSEQVKKTGILKRAYGYYSLLSIFVFAGFFFSLYQLVMTENIGHLIAWSLFFGFFAVQVSGLLHDAGHRAIFTRARVNDIFGTFFGAILSTDFLSWKYRHNLHHAHPNDEDVDPDIIQVPFLSFSKKHFESKKGILRKISTYQVYFYYPLLLLYNFGLRAYGIEYYIRLRFLSMKNMWTALLYVVSAFVWFVLPFLVFPLGKAVIVFVIVNITMSTYLLNIIASNHKAMPKIARGMRLSFMDQQIITSSNINASWLNDFLYMGLNYQIEHHLFPNCPRNKLHKITPFVKEICRKRRLEYTVVGFLQSNKNILAELDKIARS